MHRRSLLPVAAAVLAAPVAFRAAFAWPDQPVRIVVPFTPGTGPDIIARFVAEKLSPRLGQPVIVDNVAGASGNIGSQQVARAKPDGLTLMSSVNTLVMNASLFKNLPYDPVTDFAPIGLTAWGSLVLVANPSQPPSTLAELVTAAKANPKKLTYGSPGVGTPHHLSMALVEQAAGIELLHVPYKGTAGAVQDLLGGQIGYMFLPVHVSAQYIRAGKLKAIAAGSPRRLPQLPDVPTLIEQGMNAEVGAWFGMLGPAGMSPEAIAWVNREATKVFSTPDTRDRFVQQGAAVPLGTPEAFGRFIEAESSRYGDIIRRAGIKLE